MADEADVTAERMEKQEAALIAAARQPSGPVATGRCLYCDEIVGDAQRWCDTECHQGYEREVAARRRVGLS